MSMTFPIYEKKGFSVSSGPVTKDENKAQHRRHSPAAALAQSSWRIQLCSPTAGDKNTALPTPGRATEEQVHGILGIISKISLLPIAPRGQPEGCDCLRTGGTLFNLPPLILWALLNPENFLEINKQYIYSYTFPRNGKENSRTPVHLLSEGWGGNQPGLTFSGTFNNFQTQGAIQSLKLRWQEQQYNRGQSSVCRRIKSPQERDWDDYQTMARVSQHLGSMSWVNF